MDAGRIAQTLTPLEKRSFLTGFTPISFDLKFRPLSGNYPAIAENMQPFRKVFI